jgi:hypothetical protein
MTREETFQLSKELPAGLQIDRSIEEKMWGEDITFLYGFSFDRTAATFS